MVSVYPTLTYRDEDGLAVPVLAWRFPHPMRVVSTAVLGGGIGFAAWVLNATVPMSYARTDPDVHLAEIGADLGLSGPGVGLMTGVDTSDRVTRDDGGVQAVATVGLGAPAWAAAPDGHLRRYRPGTINIVVRVPARLSDAALVNAVATATEAKAQALWEIGMEATGTASDAVVVVCEPDGPVEPYGGPRSTWGARIARAVHAAVRDGGSAWLRGGTSWSERVAAAPAARVSAGAVPAAGDVADVVPAAGDVADVPAVRDAAEVVPAVRDAAEVVPAVRDAPAVSAVGGDATDVAGGGSR